MLTRNLPPMDTRPANWFIVTSAPRKEFDAMHWLIGSAIHAYVPLARAIQRRARGKTAAVLEPMFRGYLFVGDPGTDRRDLIPATPGVQRVLDVNGRWKIISDRIVQAIYQQELEERFRPPPEAKKRHVFKAGEFVKIVDGQFAGFAGRFDRLAGKDRIVVLHWLLGCEVKTTLHADQVVAA